MSHLRVVPIYTPRITDTAGLVSKRVEGSGDSFKDPKIIWLVRPSTSPERNQAIADVAREVAHYAKQRYIWIRTRTVYDIDYENVDDNGEPKKERSFVPDHPHITVYTSCDPDFIQLEGHAYVTYSDGFIIGLATEDELVDEYKGQNPLLTVYCRGVHVPLEGAPSRSFEDRRPPPEKPREFPWWRR
ncbi:hypothetical protein LIA77_00648 [Sarocladium implicatum]|nr:hypothetical protein LIA77_00648 [Sarocladium implicatum]